MSDWEQYILDVADSEERSLESATSHIIKHLKKNTDYKYFEKCITKAYKSLKKEYETK